MRKIRIINANSKFSEHSEVLDNFVKEKLSKLNVEVLYNTSLEKIDDTSNTFSVKNSSGNQETLEFNYLYVHAPSKANPLYENLGISNDGVQIDVN